MARLLLSVPVPISASIVLPSSSRTARRRGRSVRVSVAVPATQGQEGPAFDPAAAPPFGLADIRAAIPKHCWVKDPWRSMAYVLRDVVLVLGLAAAAARLDSWLVWPLYWAAQGTMFWALFVLGHDCGHGSFSNNPSLNSVVPRLVCILLYSFLMGPLQMLKLYFLPYWVFVMWLDFVTYLHHHGHNDKLPWYRGKEWTYLRGGLTTLDRDYGWINNIHHDIGTHVIHHLFPQIPHYHLIEATEAAKPVLGKYYREPQKSGPLPFHLLGDLVRSLRRDHYVSDTGDVVYYQTDPKLH